MMFRSENPSNSMTATISYWNYSTGIYAGENALSILPNACKQHSLQNIFLFSDADLQELGLVGRIVDSLRERGHGV